MVMVLLTFDQNKVPLGMCNKDNFIHLSQNMECFSNIYIFEEGWV